MSSVVVLGGGSEIGLAIARALVGRGARGVVLAAHHPAALDAEAAALRAAGAQVEVLPFEALDVDTHAATVADAFERARRLAGDVDVVVIAFAALSTTRPLDTDPAEAGRGASVNYAGVVSAGLAAAGQLRTQGHGTLVVLSSMAGQRPRISNFPYASAKAGVDAFAEGLNEALGRSGVNVISVRPGFVRTKFVAGLARTPFSTSPEQVAKDTVRGIERHAQVVWSPPVMRWVALALRLAPRWLFRLMVRGR